MRVWIFLSCIHTFYAMWMIQRYICISYHRFSWNFLLDELIALWFSFCLYCPCCLSEGNMTFWIFCSLNLSDNEYRDLSVTKVYFLSWKVKFLALVRFLRKPTMIYRPRNPRIHRNRLYVSFDVSYDVSYDVCPFLLIVHPCRSYHTVSRKWDNSTMLWARAHCNSSVLI